MTYVIEPAGQVSLPVTGNAQRFPVHQIYCVGRNYADHAVEMGSDPDREPPFFFMKPDYAVLPDNTAMQYPDLSGDVHHEVELVVAMREGGRHIPADAAMSLVYGFAVGVDMTRRDLQAEAKEASRPWEAGKVFRHAAPCSAVSPIALTGDMQSGKITLAVNGEVRQQGNVNQMIWKVPEVISRLSVLFELYPGDLIFTGTPAGVGPVSPGDTLEAKVEGLPVLTFSVSSS